MITAGESVASYCDSEAKTGGNYATEDDAKAAFLEAFLPTGCFNIYSEVDCWYFGGSVFGDRPNGRIDFVLTPRKPLLDKSWLMGCVGIEVKKSGSR